MKTKKIIFLIACMLLCAHSAQSMNVLRRTNFGSYAYPSVFLSGIVHGYRSTVNKFSLFMMPSYVRSYSLSAMMRRLSDKIVNVYSLQKNLWFVLAREKALRRAVTAHNEGQLKKLLFKNKSGVNTRDGHGYTLLHLATSAVKTSPGIIAILLDGGAEPNAKNSIGRTPLHQAAHYEHLEAVKMLLSRGANPNSVDICGKTPLDLAGANQPPSSNTLKIIELLKPLANKSLQSREVVLNRLEALLNKFRNKVPVLDILGIPKGSSKAKIQKAYIVFVKQNHPDLFKDQRAIEIATEIMALVNSKLRGN